MTAVEPLDQNRTFLYLLRRMSRQSGQSEHEMPTVANSDGRQDSQITLVSRSRSKSTSGQENVLNDVHNHWSPHSPPGPPFPEEKQGNFWRTAIAVVIMPFVLTGAPVPCAIMTSKVEQDTPVDTTSRWLKSMFTNVPVLPIVGITLAITLALNAWHLYLFSHIFIKLFILGEVPDNFVDTLIEFAERVPIVMAVDFFWFKGYLLKEIIYKMDRISLDRRPDPIQYIFKLVVIYTICVSLHVINHFTFQWRLKLGFTSVTNGEYYEHLMHRVVNTFMIPVYITICSATHKRIERTNEYIRQTIADSERPDILHLQDIKREFKANAHIIRRINSAFNLLMTAFLSVILLGMARDLVYTVYSILAYTSFSKAATNGSDFFQTDLMREMVRCISADVVVLSMKLLLIGLTVLQMISVNHESRATATHLTDLFSQFSHSLQPDLYRSYRLLKYYMSSRLEKTDKPALVTIGLLSGIPFVKSRLSTRIK